MAAASPQPMILRVVEPDQARKLKLSSRPASVDAVINIIKEQLEINFDFDLLYEDPDFEGKLTSLADIEELPQKAVVHISLSQDSSSIASTVQLSDVSSPERVSRWPPGPFPVPIFAFDVELKLRDGNAEYEKNNTHLKLTRDLKHDILEKLSSAIYGFKAYPSDKEIAKAAEALVAKHPCLKEAGSETGWNGWKNSIKFKMGNYRNKMRWAGCQEVTVNAGKRSRSNPENESSHSNIKRPKRAEVNFLPNFPQGKDPSSLEQLRQTNVEEVKKTEKSLPLIRKMMETTFPLRRQTIVMSCPPVNELMDLWPALKIESEVIWISSLFLSENDCDSYSFGPYFLLCYVQFYYTVCYVNSSSKILISFRTYLCLVYPYSLCMVCFLSPHYKGTVLASDRMFSKTFSCKCPLAWFQSLTPLRFSGNLADSCVQNMALVLFTSYNETQVSLVKGVLVVNGSWLKKDKLYVICSFPCVSL
uniref:Uncharacterized protein n=1 Tax=Cyclopterus lumpus TaxID=8103 RepID=A0A8C3AFD0_CYCLU